MVMQDQSTCPKCGGVLKYYDSVPRIVRTKGRETTRVPMRRFRCAHRSGSSGAAGTLVSVQAV